MKSLSKLAETNEETIVFGDFNLPNIDWFLGSIPGRTDTANRILILQKDFVDSMLSSGYSWSLTDEVTRRRLVNGVLQESTLDQIFSTNSDAIIDFEVFSPLGKSDHPCILSELF